MMINYRKYLFLIITGNVSDPHLLSLPFRVLNASIDNTIQEQARYPFYRNISYLGLDAALASLVLPVLILIAILLF
jgi:hypothetical protein